MTNALTIGRTNKNLTKSGCFFGLTQYEDDNINDFLPNFYDYEYFATQIESEENNTGLPFIDWVFKDQNLDTNTLIQYPFFLKELQTRHSYSAKYKNPFRFKRNQEGLYKHFLNIGKFSNSSNYIEIFKLELLDKIICELSNEKYILPKISYFNEIIYLHDILETEIKFIPLFDIVNTFFNHTSMSENVFKVYQSLRNFNPPLSQIQKLGKELESDNYIINEFKHKLISCFPITNFKPLSEEEKYLECNLAIKYLLMKDLCTDAKKVNKTLYNPSERVFKNCSRQNCYNIFFKVRADQKVCSKDCKGSRVKKK